jgi:O-antigen/teichoic acid export membrane protein
MSIKKNFIYSSIVTVSNYLFPFITYPYVSRVLGVTNIGICNFVDSIINYFILFSMMGIGIIGIREIARVNNDQQAVKDIFSKLFFINGVTTLIALIVLICYIQLSPSLFIYKDLLYIGALKLVANFLLIDWLYKGLEDFKYITKITLTIKVLYVISVFIFIKDKNDYDIYYILLTLMIVINAGFNCLHARRFIHINKNTLKGLGSIVKPFLILGIYSLLTSMYTSFNVAYLGFVSSPTEVGYYTTATKLYTIILALFSAFTGVMLPRMSSLISERKTDQFKQLIYKSIDILIMISFPTIIISTFFAPEIINIISGEGYEGAILPTIIIMPLIFIIGYEQVLIIQILMPLQKDKAIFLNSIIGAIIGITLNLLLVDKYQSYGSAIVWVCAEISVLISAQYFTTKYIKVYFPLKKLLYNLILYMPIILVYYIYKRYCNNGIILNMIISILLMSIYFFFIQIRIIRNEFIRNIYFHCKNLTSRR